MPTRFTASNCAVTLTSPFGEFGEPDCSITINCDIGNSLAVNSRKKRKTTHTKTAYCLQRVANEFHVAGLGTHEGLSVRLRYPVERTQLENSPRPQRRRLPRLTRPFSEGDAEPIKARQAVPARLSV